MTTLREIQLEIAKEEALATDDGQDGVVNVVREHSPGSFVTEGLDLEQAQWVYFFLLQTKRLTGG